MTRGAKEEEEEATAEKLWRVDVLQGEISRAIFVRRGDGFFRVLPFFLRRS